MTPLALFVIASVCGLLGWVIGRGAPEDRVSRDLSGLMTCPHCGTVEALCSLCGRGGAIPSEIQERFRVVEEWKAYIALDEACYRRVAWKRGPIGVRRRA